MGTGTIRKLILVDKADTHKQDGGSWNVSANIAKDAISSFGFGVKGGDSSKVEEGKAYFECPGVEVLERITITAEEYDRRYGVNATKHFTPDGEAAPAFAPAYSGTLELGENSVGFEVPNVMIPGQRTETTSQQITRRDIETYLSGLSEQSLSNDEFLNEMARHMRQLEEGGAHEDVLDQWKKQYEACVDALTTDPTDISDYSAPYEDMDEPEPAAADETAAASGGGEEEEYDSLDHILNQLQTPEQKFKAVCEILGVKTDGFTLDELMAANPALKDKGVLQSAIHAADNFMADSANFVGDTYQEFKATNPQAAAVVEWMATKSMMVLYAASLLTPAGRIAAGVVELSELTGFTGYAKENLSTWLKSQGFERSAEGMSAFVVGMLQSKAGKKVGALGANSKFLNELFSKVKNEVVEKIKYNRYVKASDFELPKLLTVGKYQGPEFPTIKEHFGKHGLTMETYYGNTLKHIRDCWTGKGLKVNFRHDGVDKLAHITRTGDNSFTLTVTNQNLTRIYTHFEEATRDYLSNKGITLPKGF